ncbi:MAG: site-specific integrase [Arcobacteraceae bacterium]|nr:site-specific integrase [Arcobacteraceae bacterium]
MQNKNKAGFMVRGNKIYVQGSLDGEFKRYSTGKEANKLNLSWIKKNHQKELLRIHDLKTKPKKQSTNFIEYALSNLELKASGRKAGTIKDYNKIFKGKIQPFFKNYDLNDIKRNDLMIWQNNLVKDGLAGKTINSIRGVFNFILEEARKDEIIEKNYFTLVDRVKTKAPDITPFSLDEVKLMLSKANECWQKNLIQVAFFTGLRSGELLGLKWEDINFVSKTISIKRAIRDGKIDTPKTQSSIRTIDMLPLVEDALLKQKANTYLRNSFVFLNYLGNHLYDNASIRRGFWKNILMLTGLDHRDMYQTRHTFASIMISRGEDILWVSQILGHSNPNITLSIYAKFIKTEKVTRATFLNDFSIAKNCTKTAHLKFKQKESA